MQSDRDLEQRFSAARAADEQYAPSFARVVAGRRASARVSSLRVAIAAAVAVVAVVGTWRLVTPNVPATTIIFTPGDMRTPTDFLLETMSYLRAGDIPRIGTSDLLPLTGNGSDTGRLP